MAVLSKTEKDKEKFCGIKNQAALRVPGSPDTGALKIVDGTRRITISE
jgi:hypothetical protein